MLQKLMELQMLDVVQLEEIVKLTLYKGPDHACTAVTRRHGFNLSPAVQQTLIMEALGY